MHSFTVKTALAAFLISTTLAGASAAPTSQAGREAHGTMNNNRSDAPDPLLRDDLGYTENSAGTPDLHSQPPIATMHREAMRHPTNYRPRLANIVHELRAADHRVAIDRRHGYLTAAEAAKVRHEERMIRRTAFATADEHGGRLTRPSYRKLQGEVHDLDRTIHHYATTA